MDLRRLSMFAENKHDKYRRLAQDAGEIICMQDITECERDDIDTESYVSQGLVGALLEHFLFKCLILCVITTNAVIISIQTSNPDLTKKYEIVFSVCEHVILTVFTWEILVKWFYGFGIFWRNGWNILDFLVTTALLLGPNISPYGSSIFKVMRVLRVLRSISSFATMKGVAKMMQVIWQSLPDLANILLLLIIVMLVFAVFGVTLFSASMPSAFGDLTAALYTLFICITQDGWVVIYKKFGESGASLLYSASVYFFIFLTLGAFIISNLLGAVVTTNLEMAMADTDDKNGNENFLALLMAEESVLVDTSMVHVEEVVAKTNMTKRQIFWKGSSLENLSVETFEELALVLSAMQKNMEEYRTIRKELDSIVEEVHNLPFNRQQEDAVISRDQHSASLKPFLRNEIATGRSGDMLSTLMTLEKDHVIDSGTDSPAMLQRGFRHEAIRRFSVAAMNSSMSRASSDTVAPSSPSDAAKEATKGASRHK